jgi:hypothetical protein
LGCGESELVPFGEAAAAFAAGFRVAAAFVTAAATGVAAADVAPAAAAAFFRSLQEQPKPCFNLVLQ